jgi:GTP-binding protein Era
MNRLLGQKIAIVSPKPQTTRTRISGILTKDDSQTIFVDTPGIHKPIHKLGEEMVTTAKGTIPDADVVLFVVNISERPTQEDRMIAEVIQKLSSKPIILTLNKMDLLPDDQRDALTKAYVEILPDRVAQILTSAIDGTNLDELIDTIVRYLPQGPRYYPDDQITDQTEREIAAELIREQVLLHTREEVPHSVAVVVEEFKQRDSGAIYIAANIHVERSSQKGILIGKGGQMLRRIGAAARKEIERMVGGGVYLDLWVKVSKNWRRDPKQIKRMGYTARG